MDKILDLMKRMGETVSTESMWGHMIERNPIILSEGLITSYDSKLALNAICDSFRLRKNGREKKPLLLTIQNKEYITIGDAFLSERESGEDEIKIILDTNEDFISRIEQRMNKYGWILYLKEKGIDGRTIFHFEKNFPFSFTVRQLNFYVDELYHIAPIEIKHKLSQQGLIPKDSKTPGYNNEPRIYMWKNLDDALSWMQIPKNNKNEKKIICKIYLNKLNPDNKLYIDGRLSDAVFSKEPIPPTAIEIIENI